MLRNLLLITWISCSCNTIFAQTTLHLKDSTTVNVNTAYNNVSPAHRKLFGENYRKEWAANTRLPVIKISEILGGLTPMELGGGHQSHSLRLQDKTGKEWVLRSVQKYIEGLAPEMIKGSVYEKWLEDNFSAQHPYSALIVPILAEAVKVPHTNPVIGWVAPDKTLGKFAEEFAGTICLLEEREPKGDSDNTPKMLAELDADNDNKLDSGAFFRARLLDLLIADWGRHEDQWRWVDTEKDGKDYLVIPRDRDQVLYVNEGKLPHVAAGISTLAFIEGFNANYKDPNGFFINGQKLNQQFLNQYTYDEWMQMTREFVAALPDNVLKKAVKALPASSYALNGDLIFKKLQGRRDNMVTAMDTYYRFLYNIVDVRTSDKAELVEFTENNKGEVNLLIYKLANSGNREQVLFNNTFQPDITSEIRLFSGKGNDVFSINLPSSTTKLRIVGGEGQKKYEIKQSHNKVDVYENLDNDSFLDPSGKFNKHLSNDTLNTQKVFSNLYKNSSGIAPTIDLRSIDGLFLGLGYTTVKEGFRKGPYGSIQKISVLKNFNSNAWQLQYNGEWISAFKNTDIIIDGLADMNGNILHYFGPGNDTFFDQDQKPEFYKVNFSWYKLSPAFRVNLKNDMHITAGPSFQYFSSGSNAGRYFTSPALTGAAGNLAEDKAHAGLSLNFNWDKRDHELFPTKGLNFSLLLQGFEGLNKASHAFAQVFPALSFYKSLDAKGNIVIAERIGAAFTSGDPAFYQSAFLGSQDNLLGFKKYRFAGDQVLYNNIEARIGLPNFLHSILPGKIGLIGFYDVGRVWVKNEDSNTIHHGVGGGVYLAPFNRIFVRVVNGYSKEGWQPTVALRQRF